MIDDTRDEMSQEFAALFEASVKATPRFSRGQTIEGLIVAIGPEVALVSVGGKGEASISVEELKDDEGDVEVNVGDRIKAVVVSTQGGLTLSRRMALGAASLGQLEEAFRSGLPVEGKVMSVVKGGYEVRVSHQRAFCPFSQIDTIRSTDESVHIGRVYPFRITEFKEGGRNLIVSRRVLLEADQAARADEVRKTILVDAILKGRVVSVRDFGAFVDLGAGVQGLVHVSEMSWGRGAKAVDLVKPGDELAVKVLRVDAENGQIALGLKQLEADPWSRVPVTYAIGQTYAGRVSRVAEFGAFVELEPGIEGLAHASTFAPTGRPDGWRQVVPVGTEGEFEVLSIDLEKKRLGLALVEAGANRVVGGSAPAQRAVIAPGARVKGKIDRHESFGIFVFLAPGVVGLMPASETGLDRGVDLRKAFPVGSDIEVIVLEADASGRRIRVSKKAIEAAEEAAQVADYSARETAAQAQSFGGSLADKLRGALSSRR
jgi:small subunit ribosomal protein S1